MVCWHGRGSGALKTLQWLRRLRVRVFLEYVTVDALTFLRAPGLSGGGGGMAMAVAAFARLLLTLYNRHCPLVPWSLYSRSPLSSRPQPLGSGGDVAPCEDTREDFGLSF